MTKLRSILKSFTQPFTSIAWSPVSLLVITAAIAAFYVTMEWVFIFTRPSYLQTVPFLEKSQAFVTSAGLLILVCFLLLSPLLLLGLIVRNAPFKKFLTAIAFLLPAFLLTSLALVILDNFTYTVFNFGIVSTSGITRSLYTTLYLAAALFLFNRLIAFHNLLAAFFLRTQPKKRLLLIGAILLLAGAGAVLPAESILNTEQGVGSHRPTPNRTTSPDILLITVDGVNAEYTSIYDHEEDTTPFLRKMSSESLKALNAFSNAQGTIGSLTAILTGKHPADTRVINSSDMLKGEDAYQHLPNILSDYGYYTAQLSNNVYADAYKTNFQDAFNEANGRSAEQDPLMFTLAKLYPGINHIFQQEVIERLATRLSHIFFISDMANPYQQVTKAPIKFNDQQKLKQVFDLLNESRQPLFIHLHWMGTHGPNYLPEEHVFSAGINVEHQEQFKQLFYYDTVLDFDRAVEEIYTYLEANDRLENTILVVTSDHSQKWTNSRIPLLIRFPESEHTGVLSQNVQTMDIAPTLLDYLGIETPEWMAGQSLISSSYEEQPIFTAKIPKSRKDPLSGKVIYPESEPPFYQFGRMSVIVCNQWFELDLQQKTMTEGKVKKYQTPCGQRIEKIQALELFIGHLERYGFDTGSLGELKTDLGNSTGN